MITRKVRGRLEAHKDVFSLSRARAFNAHNATVTDKVLSLNYVHYYSILIYKKLLLIYVPLYLQLYLIYLCLDSNIAKPFILLLCQIYSTDCGQAHVAIISWEEGEDADKKM